MQETDSLSETKNSGFSTQLFYLWTLSLPFYHYSVIGSISFDNLLAPFLLVLGGIKYLAIDLKGNVRRLNSLIILSLLLGIFALTQVLTLININQLLSGKIWRLAKLLGYFLIPVLFVTSSTIFYRTSMLLIISAVIGSLSAFLVSIGMLELSVTRFEASRLGVEWLPKSVGLISNYGDMAILLTLTFVVILSCRNIPQLRIFSDKRVLGFLVITFILGFLGSQSRNMVLSMFVGGAAYLATKLFVRPEERFRGILLFLVSLPFLLASVLVMVWNYAELIEFAKDPFGGSKVAAANAEVRLKAIEKGFQLFAESPIFGMNADIYKRNVHFVEQMHNMWMGMLLRGGLVSVFAFLGLITRVFWSAIGGILTSRLKTEGRLVIGLVSGALVAALFYPAHNSYFFWYILGFCISIGNF